MRVASFALVGIVVTTSVVVIRHLSERDETGRGADDWRGNGDGTTDPTKTPTPQNIVDLAPGEKLTISLSGEPATHYSSEGIDDAYRDVAVAAASGRAFYDAALSRAAAEVAIQGALHRAVAADLPESVATFLLHSAGAPDSSSARFSLRTNDDDDQVVARAIDEALSSPPHGVGDLFFGVGETHTPSEPHSRHIVILMSRRAYSLERSPRTVALGQRWQGRGQLPPGFGSPTAKVLYPSGQLIDASLTVDGDRFTLSLESGDQVGQIHVGIDGIGETGPGKLMQISLEVGRPPPRELVITIAEPEGVFADISEAETLAAALLAADRATAGAPVLEVDAELAAIARAHSQEMADRQFFAHQSPTTGLAGDRIAAAGYRASSFAENLAKNDRVREAESSLLGSVGHRANLLSHDFTHVGIGIAKAIERGQTQWYLTQLFAKKTVEVDVVALRATVYETIAKVRADAGEAEISKNGELEAIAYGGAERAAAGETDDIAGRLGREARDALARSVAVSVQVVYSAKQIAVPENVRGDQIESVGVGVFQSTTDRAGRIGVVVITGRRR